MLPLVLLGELGGRSHGVPALSLPCGVGAATKGDPRARGPGLHFLPAAAEDRSVLSST